MAAVTTTVPVRTGNRGEVAAVIAAGGNGTRGRSEAAAVTRTHNPDSQ